MPEVVHGPASDLAEPRHTRMRVLLVEDNAGDIELVRELSSGMSIALECFTDARAALARILDLDARHAIPDLVLLDLKLPGFDGLELLAELERHPAASRIPVVVLTSSKAPHDVARAYRLGARACFAKPMVGLDDLLRTVIDFYRRALPLPEPDEIPGGGASVSPTSSRPATADVQRALRVAGIVDSLAEAVIGVAIDGTITSWNPAAEALYGYRASEAVGRPIGLIVGEERRAELEHLLSQVLGLGEVRRLRTVRVTRDGQLVHVALTLSPIKDAGGAIVGKAIIARDISDQMRAEERFRLAVEAAPSAMLMVDAQGHIVMVNAESERLFGYTREELIGVSVEQLIPERLRGGHPDHRRLFTESPESRPMGAGRELHGLRKDGLEVPVEIGLNPIQTPDGTFVLASIVDISERRLADLKFRLAVEASPSGIVMVDDRGRIALVNAETERMFGYSRSELINRSVDILVPERFRGQHAHHRAGFSGVARAMGMGRDLHGVRKDGSEFPVEVGLNPIITAEGRFVLSTIVDITARKRAEGALSQQAQELARSNDELQQFAYVASHDLQEPLRMMASYTDLLAKRYADQLDDKALTYISYAKEGAMRMARLIDDLLAYSRVRTRGRELRPVDLRGVIDQARQNLELTIRDAGAVIRDDVAVTVLADEGQLVQVMQNLLSNAIKFRRAEPPEVWVRANRDGAKVTVTVSDNGIGIDPAHFERVFQMFDRLHARDVYPGTGIGLALCRRIVDRHGGRIWIESDGATGTTVLFTLRSADKPHAALT